LRFKNTVKPATKLITIHQKAIGIPISQGLFHYSCPKTGENGWHEAGKELLVPPPETLPVRWEGFFQKSGIGYLANPGYQLSISAKVPKENPST
jgi:hypothetical protein